MKLSEINVARKDITTNWNYKILQDTNEWISSHQYYQISRGWLETGQNNQKANTKW